MPNKAKNQDSKSKWSYEKSSGRYEEKHHEEKKEEKHPQEKKDRRRNFYDTQSMLLMKVRNGTIVNIKKILMNNWT